MKALVRSLDDVCDQHGMAADWVHALRQADPELDSRVRLIAEALDEAGNCLPSRERIWRAYETPLAEARVIILGQDPYPNPQHAVGLSFSTGPGGPIPGSLKNIFLELEASKYRPGVDGDLSVWTTRGVLLLNRALTIPEDRDQRPKRHLRLWAPVLNATAKALAAESANRPVAALLWGRPAHAMAKRLGADVHIVASSHPSDLGARRKSGGHPAFLGSRPFAKINQWMESRGVGPVDWNLT